MAITSTLRQIGLVGYGEVGRILAEDLVHQGLTVRAMDVKFALEDAGGPLRRHAAEHGVQVVATHRELAEVSELVISAVTASQTLGVAEACAPGCGGGTWFLDFNSASPGAKIRAGSAVNGRGGRYVEGAVMTSVPPYRIRVPLLLGGPDADALGALLAPLGFAPRTASPTLGVASATKMCRSVIIKGMEAMMIESLTAARHHGVEDAVLASLAETFPGLDWQKQATYFFQRVIEHGRRRSEELRESAETVREAGLVPWSADGTADRQAWVAGLADEGVFTPKGSPGFARSDDWRTEADRMLAHLRTPRPL